MNSILLLFSLLGLLLLGAPIPVAMGVATLTVLWFGDYPLYIMAQILISSSSNWSLLAVPFFIMAGGLMNELGITDRLFRFARACVGHIRGGLAHVNVLASMIFAGISGAATADVGGLGKIEMKAMEDAGFSKKVSAGITVASSVVGPIIPPSIAFVLYGVMAEVSIARLFLAGLLPGILIGLSLMATSYLLALKHPDQFPTEKRADMRELLVSSRGAALAVMAPVLILLGMTSGFISPTEAGAGAALYSVLVGAFYRTIRWRALWGAIREAMVQSAHAILLVALAGVMGYIMTFERTPNLIAEVVGGLTNRWWAILLLADLLFLVVGLFMSATAGLIILTPIFLPIMKKVGVDPIHFGVIISYALHIGIATPPVGIGLYIISDIGKLRLEEAVSAVLPYLVPLVISLFFITFIPQLSLWLPGFLMP